MNYANSPPVVAPLSVAHLLRDAAILGGVMLLVSVPVGLMAWQGHGATGLASTAVAAAVCYGSAMISLLVAYLLRDPSQAVTGMLLGMGIRAGVPMLFGLYMTQTEHPWAAAGLFGQILLFYLAGLAVETVLRVGQLKRVPDARSHQAAETSSGSQTS